MTGPLSTLRVVEFSGIGPAPLAGQLLADVGAEVIVIDRNTAMADNTDINRRGKKSIALNLKTEAGLSIARKLVSRSDILIEGFRPGVMERLGLGPDDCPDHLIYGRMTGWGQTGGRSNTAGHDINYLAVTGALNAMGSADTPPEPPLNLVADFGGGTMFLLFGLLAAVIERGISGKGQVVDAAMVDGVPAMMGLIHGFLAQGQWNTQRGTNWLDGASHFYRCYRCADGKFISVGALEPQFFGMLADILELPETLREGQFDKASWQEKSDAIAEVFAKRTRDQWSEIFANTDACVAPVLDFGEAVSQKDNTDRKMFVEVEGVWQSNVAPRFGRSEPAPLQPPSGAGVDTSLILAQLGYSEEEIGAFKSTRALT